MTFAMQAGMSYRAFPLLRGFPKGGGFRRVYLCLRLAFYVPFPLMGKEPKDQGRLHRTSPRLSKRLIENLPSPSQQAQGNGPEDRPERHEGHETVVLGLVSEEHHAHPAAHAPA